MPAKTRLVLHLETLRALEPADLAHVRGGDPDTQTQVVHPITQASNLPCTFSLIGHC